MKWTQAQTQYCIPFLCHSLNHEFKIASGQY